MQLQLPRATTGAAELIGLAAEYGVPAGRLLAGSGIAGAALDDPAAEITAAAELAVVRNLLGELGHVPGLGLLAGHRYHVGLFGIWGFALLTSPTIRDALVLAVRYADLTNSFSRLTYAESAREATLEFDDSAVPADVRGFLLQRDVASAVRLQQDILRAPLTDLRIELTMPEPADAALFAEITGVRPTFGAPRNLLIVPAEALDRALPQANPLVTAATQDQCAALLRARRERLGVAGQVRRVLLAGRPARIRQQDVASELALSPRTLHRRLAAEGTTYRDLVAEATVLLAEEMLAAALTVEDVAVRLGYAGAPAFTVAFKKTTGMTPGGWARAHRQP